MRVFILIFQLLVFSSSARSLSPDGWALLHFRSNIEEDPKQALSNWNAYDQDPCSWFGVSCWTGKVTSVNLSRMSLKGTLSPELGQLVNLQKLILRENGLTGFIPFQLGELGKLEVLDLAHNHFSGHLPEDLGNLSSLSELYLENNNLEGIIPAELILSLNKLTGVIPGGLNTETETLGFHHGRTFEAGVCKLKFLQVADFSSNYFEGDLPAWLHHLPSASFSFNCLLREGASQQRPIEDCTRAPYSIPRRHLLQSEGSAGGNGTINNRTEPTPFDISDRSPAPSPSPAPVQASMTFATPAAAPLATTSPASSREVKPSTPAGSQSSPSLNMPTPPSASSSSRMVLAVVVATSIATCSVIAGVVVFLCCRRKGTAVRPWKGSMSGELQKGFTKGVPAFSRVELEAACEDFSNIIGFCPDIVLFKGTLTNGAEIAVTSIRKSAKSWSSKSEWIFWQKVGSLSQMKHQNLVNLLGYCAEEDPFIRMLVFEYVPNGTVHEHLHNKESEHLDWETRMRIIMGVAYALDYMHHGFDSPVIHTKLDTKSVFLSEDFSAKVSDFGVWKVSQSHKDVEPCNDRHNILGHEDLELSNRLTPLLETNIYDFGVFLLEMVSGRPPYSKEFGSLAEWALSYISLPQQVACIVDPTLEVYNLEELEVVARMACDCLQPDASKCLTMRQMSCSLSSSLSSIKEPKIRKSSPLLWAELQILSQD